MRRHASSDNPAYAIFPEPYLTRNHWRVRTISSAKSTELTGRSRRLWRWCNKHMDTASVLSKRSGISTALVPRRQTAIGAAPPRAWPDACGQWVHFSAILAGYTCRSHAPDYKDVRTRADPDGGR